MKQEATAIEHDLLDPGLHRSFRHALADRGRGVDVRTRFVAHVLFQARSGGNGLAVLVVDHLSIDVLARTMHREARTPAATRTKRGTVAPAALLEKRKTLGH